MPVIPRGSLQLCVLAVCLVASVRAQPTGTDATTSARPSVPRIVTQSTSLALEGPLDPDTYVVGPGDMFTISVGGTAPRQYSAMVSADGRVAVPEAGSVVAAGRSLARVRADVQGALQRRNLTSPVDVSLARPRDFYVHVTGAVAEPGRHLVPAVARVSQAVEAAAGTPLAELAQYDERATSVETLWPALRNVTVTSRDGGERQVDLARYLSTGVLDGNPYLSDGDRVHTPAFSPLAEGIIVDGGVERPGVYDARAGDTALDLVEVAGAASAGRIARVRVTRLGRPPVEVPLGGAGGVAVGPGDHVYAVLADAEAASVRVDGAVRYPGVYPIVQGETTVGDLVAMAGGLRDDALARGAHLERAPQLVENETARSEGVEVALPDVSVDSDLLQGLFGRQFFARQTAATPRVSMDPEAALANAQPIRLYRGDRLVVPFDYGLVRVYGRVLRNGYVPFVEGAQASDYVTRAGGVSSSASAVYVVDAATGQLSEGESQVVRRGDAVFVNSLPSPDSPEFATLALQERAAQREDDRDRRSARYQFVQTVLGVAGTVVSVIALIVATNGSNN